MTSFVGSTFCASGLKFRLFVGTGTPQSAKSKMMRHPSGIALITPESIEAMFVRRPADAKRLLSKLDFIVVDELHAFMLGPRGLHLASLFKRIDSWSQKPARRIGLSATIGDLGQAAAWLRPSDPSRVVIMQDVGEGLDLKLPIRGYLEHVRTTKRKGEESAADAENAFALGVIADHLFLTLRDPTIWSLEDPGKSLRPPPMRFVAGPRRRKFPTNSFRIMAICRRTYARSLKLASRAAASRRQLCAQPRWSLGSISVRSFRSRKSEPRNPSHRCVSDSAELGADRSSLGPTGLYPGAGPELQKRDSR